jgi:hypothetical protein
VSHDTPRPISARGSRSRAAHTAILCAWADK